MNLLQLTCGSGESALDTRSFEVSEAISQLFSVDIVARCANAELDLSRIVGHPAALQLSTGYAMALDDRRVWSGVCAAATQLQAEPTGVSTYALRIVPNLWLLTQRTNQRIFQHKSIVDIVDAILAEWKLTRRWEVDRARYPKLDFKVQHHETDYAFVCRLLEEAGIAFLFEEDARRGSSLLLGDALHNAAPRNSPPLPYMDNPNKEAGIEYVTKVGLSHQVRPGASSLADYDFRHPAMKLITSAPPSAGLEGHYEQYRYQPGSMLAETTAGGNTPAADQQGAARHLQSRGTARSTRELEAHRSGREQVSFETNAVDLRPGSIFSIDHHQHPELSAAAQLLVTAFHLHGDHNGEWTMSGKTVFADRPFRPALTTPKPSFDGVQSATVVGPAGEEIHTDEFGRIRIHFPWDRDGTVNEHSSCWIRVNQGWAGAKYGMINLPRIGQEVLVSFLDGDPDRPVVVGRVFNAANPVPYKLPQHKTISAQKSNASVGSNGYNEIKIEDDKGEELLFVQAEKNLRQAIFEDDTATIVRDRFKLVKNDYRDTIQNIRTQITKQNRIESTEGNRAITITGDLREQIGNNENERTDGNTQAFYRIDHDLVVAGDRRDLVHQESHYLLQGSQRAATRGKHSVVVQGRRHERVMGRHASRVDGSFYLRTGSKFVAEGIEDVTFKTGGGFIRINSSGLVIEATQVKINSGGSADQGASSAPDIAASAQEKAFQISPQRVAELITKAIQHGVPLPDSLHAAGVEGVMGMLLARFGEAKVAAAFEQADAAVDGAHSAKAMLAAVAQQLTGGKSGA